MEERQATMQATTSTEFEKRINMQQLIAPLSLIIIVVVLSFASEYFFTVQNMFNIGRQAAINLIIALGMTVVILTAGIDLSVGSICAFTLCVMAKLSVTEGYMSIWAAMCVAILIGTLCGMLNGVIIHFGNVPPFVATLGMMGIARGAALIITRGSPTVGFPESFQWIGGGYVLDVIPFPLILAGAITLLCYLMLKFTVTGRNFYAVGGNEEASRLSGIRISTARILAYTISGLCSAIAGVVLASRVNAAPPAAGTGYELNAIAAVVIGGTNLFGGEGSVLGTVLGALIMAVLANGLSLLDVSPFVQQVVIGWVIILAVLVNTVRKKRT
jgi:ribose transport system permease protein